jgi:hypothetical protein
VDEQKHAFLQAASVRGLDETLLYALIQTTITFFNSFNSLVLGRGHSGLVRQFKQSGSRSTAASTPEEEKDRERGYEVFSSLQKNNSYYRFCSSFVFLSVRRLFPVKTGAPLQPKSFATG